MHPSTPPAALYLSVRDVQALLGVGRASAYELIHRAGPTRVGRLLRVRRDRLFELLERYELAAK